MILENLNIVFQPGKQRLLVDKGIRKQTVVKTQKDWVDLKNDQTRHGRDKESRNHRLLLFHTASPSLKRQGSALATTPPARLVSHHC